MVDKTPNSRRNLDIAITRKFGQSGNPYDVRTLMANTIIGQLLPDGAVKGGSSLKLRYGDKCTRFTTDLDAARAGELDTYVARLEVALEKGWNGFTGRVLPKEPAKPKSVPGEYIMLPFDIKLEYKNAAWLTVRFELGHDEVGDTDDPDYSISSDIIDVFKQLGFPAPEPIALMPIPHQIAQKLHAVSAANSERAHDLIDLQLIIKHEDVDYAKTRDTCQRLFKSRKQQPWPPTIIKGENWAVLYNDQLRNLDVLKTVDEAVIWVNELILRINTGSSKG